ncbi:MAG TPA: DUF1501 domain-containing protein [Pirellulales bacterium]|nr:DUF1501 domain-containing protein [Pirellulales bacterium]
MPESRPPFGRLHADEHQRANTANPMLPPRADTIRCGSRRWFLQTGTAGLAGLSLVDLLKHRAAAATATNAAAPAGRSDKTSVILLWLSGGPSHIDMWDPKPDAPQEIRGPYQAIDTRVPGIQVCEHLPLTAQLMPRLSIIRSVDCSASNHTPITMQAGNALARRSDDGNDGQGYPSMGSIVARLRGPNAPNLPAFVGLADSWKADVWGAGHMGNNFEPVNGKELPGRLAMPKGIAVDRVRHRDALRHEFDRFRRDLDLSRAMDSADRFSQMAVDMVTSERVQRAFDLSQEDQKTRDAYGPGSLGEKTLLARRLVEAGVTFTLVSGKWGYFDHHGDEVVWGGIQKGLTPILPVVDRALFALINDLEARGLLDSTLVLMMGEFGRTPVMTATAGRGHWTNCMSMIVAGGGLPMGQVIGSTDRRGYDIAEAPVRPADLAATVFRHLDIDLDAQWVNRQGRPIPIVTEGGRPIPGLS